MQPTETQSPKLDALIAQASKARTPRTRFVALCKLAAVTQGPVHFSAWWYTGPRRILSATATQASFEHPTQSKASWLTYPPASEIFERRPGQFTITAGPESEPRFWLTYTFGSGTFVALPHRTLDAIRV